MNATRDDGKNRQRLENQSDHGGNSGVALHAEGSSFQRGEEQRAWHNPKRVQARKYREQLAAIVQKDVGLFNAMLKEKDIPNIFVQRGTRQAAAGQ